MRSFSGDEPFEPVAWPRPPDASDQVPEKQRRLAGGLIGVVFVGVAIWMAVANPDNRLAAVIFGGAGAIAIVVSLVPWPRGGRLKPAAGLLFMGIMALVIDLYAWAVSDAAAGIFGTLLTVGFVFIAVRSLQERKVAALMRGSGARVAIPGRKEPQAILQSSDPRDVPAPFRLDVYLQSELPALSMPYRVPLDADRNIVGLPPQRILYLYNFFSAESLMQKMKGNWRRFGPVYFLGSPSDIAAVHTFDWHIGDGVKRVILDSPEAFNSRFDNASMAVLPPGDKQLKDVSYLSGGYSQDLFLCTDSSWRHAVDRLFDHADIVVVDACDYDAERGGLNWELGELVNRVSTRNFVVLVDEATDQPALYAEFRSAWGRMRTGSPNDRSDVPPLRWVVLGPNDAPRSSFAAVPPEADPAALYPTLNPLMKTLMNAHYDAALTGDRIYGLFIH